MRKETDEEYAARREQEELMLAITSSDGRARDIHYALANGYREILDERNQVRIA